MILIVSERLLAAPPLLVIENVISFHHLLVVLHGER